MKFVVVNKELETDLHGPPSLADKIQNFVAAGAAWVSEGAPLASSEDKERRAKICDACSYWKADGNLGLGECSAPGCGCTRAKLWLATSKCTHPDGARW